MKQIDDFKKMQKAQEEMMKNQPQPTPPPAPAPK